MCEMLGDFFFSACTLYIIKKTAEGEKQLAYSQTQNSLMYTHSHT